MNEVDLNNVTEPHDFEHAQLVNLDTTLRCSICKDLINVPMFAPCSHSFCSMCIRESLTVKPECPVCRTATSDGLLKRNTMLSEVVEAYKLARQTILGHEKESNMNMHTGYPASVLGKRKRSDMSITSSGNSPGTSKMSRLDSNGSSSKTSPMISPNGIHNMVQSPLNTDTRLSMVSCPICEEIVDANYINTHLDNSCSLNSRQIEGLAGKRQNRGGGARNETSQAKAWANVLGPRAAGKAKLKGVANDIPMKRISKVNYDIKTTKQLRELLAEEGLNDKGDVPQLRARHERWVNMWNAEVDAPKPRPRHTLVKDVTEWEQALARTKNKPIPKVENSKAWLETNRDQFDRLIADARVNARARRGQAEEDEEAIEAESPEVVDLVSSSPRAA